MAAEQTAKANSFLAEGEREYKKITSLADKTVRITIADAEEYSLKERGRGDRQAAEIYREAYTNLQTSNKDGEVTMKPDQDAPSLFEFLRSLEAYEKSMGSENTTFVMAPKGPFFKHFGVGNSK